MSMEVESLVQELLPGYALGILDGEDSALVEQHLATCERCQDELAHLQHVAEDLPLALVQTVPPEGLKGRIFSEIHARKAIAAAPRRHSFWQQLEGFMRRSAPAWAIAVIGIMALMNWSLWKRLNQEAVIATPAMRVIALANTDASPSAVATLIMDQEGMYGTLVVDKLAELNPDQQYQVWLIKDGKRTSAGLFTVNYEGYASLELQAAQPLIQYDTIGVTIEPAGGSPGPTGAKVLGGGFSN